MSNLVATLLVIGIPSLFGAFFAWISETDY